MILKLRASPVLADSFFHDFRPFAASAERSAFCRTHAAGEPYAAPRDAVPPLFQD